MTKISQQLTGLHCGSCALNIDMTLEELPGIVSSKTVYATMKNEVEYDPDKVSIDQIKSTIESLGYKIKI